MFTIEQVKEAHSKVKSGADFPKYIQDLIRLGVMSYEVFVEDGRANYYGENNYKVSAGAKYETIKVASTSDIESFKTVLKEHQQGKSDYLAFCKMAADFGVEKWKLSMKDMTCTYFEKSGEELLYESIPA